MGSFSDYLENKLMDYVFGNETYTASSTLYLALSEADPLDDGSGVSEPVGNGYARKSIANNLTNWPAAVNGVKANGTIVELTAVGGSWPTVSHFAIFDEITGGNMLIHGALSSAQTLADGESIRFPVDSIDLTLD